MIDLTGNARGVLIARGVIAILFGLLALVWPGLTLLVLVAMFAAYAILAGGATLVWIWRTRKTHGHLPMGATWMYVIIGVAAIVFGLLAAFWPQITALTLVLIMGANAVVIGFFDLAVAWRQRRTAAHVWLIVLAGLVSIVFGLAVLMYPGAGALALVWLISMQAIVTGVLMLVAASRARRQPPAARPGPGASTTV
jgi:uncharacterized membrane protein HdeD (DUF308 family)